MSRKCIRLISLFVLVIFVASCTELWELRFDGDSSEVAHTLCVAANATIVGGELSFAAAVAPVRSLGFVANGFESYPLDSLILELKVDGVSYYSETIVRDSLLGGERGFIINEIPVTSDTPEVGMTIRDKAGNYHTVSASGKALDKPEMSAKVFATPSESRVTEEALDYWKQQKEKESLPDSDIRKVYDLQGPDSLYRVEIEIDPSDMDVHYYTLSVEFEFLDSRRLDDIFLNPTESLDYSKYVRLGEVPFTSDDGIFYDNKITSSISGFPAYTSNVFSNEGSKDRKLNVTIQFMSPALELFRVTGNGLRGEWGLKDSPLPLFVFYCNAQAPFHIYLSEISAETYDHYKSVQHQMCSSSSIFDALRAIPSNIEGGLGFLSIHNMQDYLHFDDTVYNIIVYKPIVQQ
jgi:hypothetical protein